MFLDDDPLLPRALPSFKETSALKRAVVVVAAMQLTVATAFFVWAVVNSTIRATPGTNAFDWGIVNFPVACIAAIAALISGTSDRRSHSVVAAAFQVVSTAMHCFIYGMANASSWLSAKPQGGLYTGAIVYVGPAAAWIGAGVLLTALLVAGTVDDDAQARVASPDRRTGKVSGLFSLFVLAASLGFWIPAVVESFIVAVGWDVGAAAFVLPIAAAVVGCFSAFDNRASLALANGGLLLLALASVVTFFAWPLVVNARAAAPGPLDVGAVVQLSAWAVVLCANIGVAWIDFVKLRPAKLVDSFRDL